MKVYIFCDIEGISGIAGGCYIDNSRPELLAAARRFMAGDINACVEGCFRRVPMRLWSGTGMAAASM